MMSVNKLSCLNVEKEAPLFYYFCVKWDSYAMFESLEREESKGSRGKESSGK